MTTKTKGIISYIISGILWSLVSVPFSMFFPILYPLFIVVFGVVPYFMISKGDNDNRAQKTRVYWIAYISISIGIGTILFPAVQQALHFG